jgi:hypothetical protein
MRSRVKGCVMTGHRVRFFKDLVNSQGTPFKTVQREIVITGAKTALEAEVIAEREFERVRQIPDWHFHADSVETEVGGHRCSSPASLASSRTIEDGPRELMRRVGHGC